MARPATPTQQARRAANRMLDLQGTRLEMGNLLEARIHADPARYGGYRGLLAHWRGPLADAERCLQGAFEADLARLDGRRATRCTRDAA